ncbi:MAG: UDP-N-acetylmuramate--L-alanine ligase [Patescibacteria group bacterium]|nr:UDP-N-acetylmuramate--L-alanine ligase [Patescibacteria group bacterium]
MKKFNFDKMKKIYFVGIKGSGVIAFVELFHLQGKEIVGSDTDEKFFTDDTLKRLGVKYSEKFDVENIKKEEPIDLVVYSTAYSPENNPELKYAVGKGIPSLSYPELIGQFMKAKYSIAVCGTHGKTTTTAMLALAMKYADSDPTAIIGSKIKQLDSNKMIGKSDYFILEADEYQNKFLHYNPNAVILTSLDYDHPDFFSSFEEYLEVFKEFVRKIPSHGFLVVWGESAYTLEVAKEASCRIIIYGSFREENIVSTLDEVPGDKIDESQIEDIRLDFSAAGKEDVEFEIAPPIYKMKLKTPGGHNMLNATAVIATCRQFGLDEEKVIVALENYEGAARRYEKLGTYNKAKIIDDYAHHPQEVRATLSAVRGEYPDKNIICVFHPHTFSRTQALLTEFSESFDDADEVIVLDIYASVREKEGKVTSKDLVDKMRRIKQNVQHIPTLEEVCEHLEKTLTSKDVLITMGAGNVFEIGKRLAGYKV